MRRTLLVLFLVGSAYGALGTTPASASALLCESEWTTGVVAQSHSVCIPYSGGQLCQQEGTGLDPTEDAFVLICIPS